MLQEKLQQVALGLLPGIGPVTVRQLISHCGSASNVFTASSAKLKAIPGIGSKIASIIRNGSELSEAKLQLKLAKKNQASIHFYTSAEFPRRLMKQTTGPALLYIKGKPVYNAIYTLGIVGTRRPTAYGKRVISRLLRQLSPYKPVIISGLAFGIDVWAHGEALDLGLPTIGVLGSGLDNIYPPAHTRISEEMQENGCLVSELKFGTKPEAYHFPARNRIIAGLSDALVVVEARRNGGALITVDYMDIYNKPCYAVPGPIDAPASIGCNMLIEQNKTHILNHGDQIATRLQWTKQTQTSLTSGASDEETNILQALSEYPKGLHIDELSTKIHIPINKISMFLLSLEVRGLIKTNPGKKFTLVRK